MQSAYDTIKSVDDKPVFILFTEYALIGSETAGPVIPVLWKNAFDQFLLDVYPTRIGEPEFSRLENEGRGKDFKNDILRAQQASIAADRPWWAVLSGWGTPAAQGFRLPTYAESRFATYWSLSQSPVGVLHFAYYRTGGGAVPALPSEPYPYDGAQWLTDVYEPQTNELNLMGDALRNGQIANLVTDDTANVRSDVYLDPNTGYYFLIALNITLGNANTTFTIDLPTHLWNVTRLFEGDPTPMAFLNGQFADTFTDYEAHVYLLSPGPPPIPGDVNLDGQVDGLDLTFLGAYWQVSGTEWVTGDLNGDGETNGLDLNIIGENWQVGVPAPGETVPEPATLALLGLGTMAMLRRRQNAAKGR